MRALFVNGFIFFDFLVISLKAICSFLTFSVLMEFDVRTKRRKELFILYLVFLVFLEEMVMLNMDTQLKLNLISSLGTIFEHVLLSVFFTGSVYKKCLGVIYVFALGTVCNVIAVQVLALFTGYEISDIAGNRSLLMIISIFCYLLFLIVILILRRIRKDKIYELGAQYNLLFIVLIFINLLLTVSFYSLTMRPVYVFTIDFLLAGSLLLMNWLFDYTYISLARREENRLLKRQMEYQTKQFEQNQHYMEAMQRLLHDINKHKVVIVEAIGAGQDDYAAEYMDEAFGIICDKYKQELYTLPLQEAHEGMEGQPDE